MVDHGTAVPLSELGVFSLFPAGTEMQARVVEVDEPEGVVRLSVRPSVVNPSTSKSAKADEGPSKWSDVHVGSVVPAFVDGVAEDGLWVSLSSKVRGFCFCTDVSADPSELERLFNKGEAKTAFAPGTSVVVRVVGVDVGAKRLNVVLVPMSLGGSGANAKKRGGGASSSTSAAAAASTREPSARLSSKRAKSSSSSS